MIGLALGRPRKRRVPGGGTDRVTCWGYSTRGLRPLSSRRLAAHQLHRLAAPIRIGQGQVVLDRTQVDPLLAGHAFGYAREDRVITVARLFDGGEIAPVLIALEPLGRDADGNLVRRGRSVGAPVRVRSPA